MTFTNFSICFNKQCLITSLFCIWIAFLFHVINVAPWDYLADRWTSDTTSRDDIVAAFTITVVTTVFGSLVAIILPAIVALYIVFIQCSSLYASSTFRIIMDGLYLLFLVVVLACNVFYQVVLFQNAGELGLDVNSFQFISGWIAIGFWSVGLIFAIVYLVFVILQAIDYYTY